MVVLILFFLQLFCRTCLNVLSCMVFPMLFFSFIALLWDLFECFVLYGCSYVVVSLYEGCSK